MNQKEYTIVINGVSQSITQVDALLAKLSEVERKLNAISGQKVDTGNSNAATYQAEAQAAKEVTSQVQRQAEENTRNLQALVGINQEQRQNVDLQKEALSIADRILGSTSSLTKANEQYAAQLKQIKEDRKEIDALEKYNQISSSEAAERRAALASKEMEIKNLRQQNLVILRNEQKLIASEEGSYQNLSYVLARMKEALKSVNMDNLDSRDLSTLATAIEQVDKKVKEMAGNMGEFQRNVGNYSSAFDGLEKLKIKIGDTEVEFNSLREAGKKLKNAIGVLEAQGKEGTEQWHQYNDALHEVMVAQDKLSDSASRAKDASKGLHDALEMFEGLTSIATIGQGFANLFGVDNGKLTESINKMTALMGVLQGINKLRNQMESGTGIGPMINRLFSFVGNGPGDMIKNMKGLGTELKAIPAEASAAGESLAGMAKGATTAGSAMGSLWKMLAGGVAGGLGMVVFEYGTEVLKEFGTYIYDLISFEDNLERSSKAYTDSINAQNKALQQNLDILEQKGKLEGKDDIQIQTEKLEEQTKAFQQQQKMFADLYTTQLKGMKMTKDAFGGFASGDIAAVAGLGDVKLDDTFILEVNKRIDKLLELERTGEDVKDEMTKSVNQMVAWWSVKMKNMDDANGQSGQKMEQLQKECTNLQFAIQRAGDSSEDMKKITTALDGMLQSFNSVRKAAYSLQTDIKNMSQDVARQIRDLETRAIANPLKRSLQQLEDQFNDDIENFKKEHSSLVERNNYYVARKAAYEQERKEMIESANKAKYTATSSRKSRVNEAERTMRELERIEKQISQDKINILNATLTKEIEIIEQERRERIKALDKFKNDQKYEGLVGDVNSVADTKVTKAYGSFFESYFKEVARWRKKLFELEMEQNASSREAISLIRENGQAYKQYANDIKYVEAGLQSYTEKYAELKKMLESYEMLQSKQNRTMFQNLKLYAKGVMLEKAREELQNAETDFDDMDKSLELWFRYWDDAYEIEGEFIAKMKELREEEINDSEKKNLEAIKERRDADLEAFDQRYNDIVNDQKKLEALGLSEEEFSKKMGEERLEITKYYENLITSERYIAINERTKNETDAFEKIKKLNEKHFGNIINEYNKFYSKLSNKYSSDSIVSRSKNSWQIINIPKLKKEKADAETEYNKIIFAAVRTQMSLRANAKNMDIMDFRKQDDELSEFIRRLNEELNKLKDINWFGEFMNSINNYVQTIGQGMQEIFSSIYDYQEYLLDREQEALDDENDLLQAKLNEQEEIISKHKDAINDIEDELKTARGDRRDALVDQLNAEVAAQRAALIAKQRLEKEQEALEKRQDDLDRKRKNLQKSQSLTQARISTALAVANGLATTPFIPTGIAMGALAAALGGVQIALIRAQKFATGGEVSGPSHARGGVQAELEGGEYVVNKHAFSQNRELVELINSAGRRLTLSDIASAGYSTPEVDFTRYSEPIVVSSKEPIYVSVVDINKAQDRVARIQEMARQ